MKFEDIVKLQEDLLKHVLISAANGENNILYSQMERLNYALDSMSLVTRKARFWVLTTENEEHKPNSDSKNDYLPF